jgi:hypothetical protein
MEFSSVFVSVGNRLIKANHVRRLFCSSFVAADAHIAGDNLRNLGLRSEVIARVAQTTRGDIKLSPFSQNKMGRAIGR